MSRRCVLRPFAETNSPALHLAVSQPNTSTSQMKRAASSSQRSLINSGASHAERLRLTAPIIDMHRRASAISPKSRTTDTSSLAKPSDTLSLDQRVQADLAVLDKHREIRTRAIKGRYGINQAILYASDAASSSSDSTKLNSIGVSQPSVGQRIRRKQDRLLHRLANLNRWSQESATAASKSCRKRAQTAATGHGRLSMACASSCIVTYSTRSALSCCRRSRTKRIRARNDPSFQKVCTIVLAHSPLNGRLLSDMTDVSTRDASGGAR